MKFHKEANIIKHYGISNETYEKYRNNSVGSDEL